MIRSAEEVLLPIRFLALIGHWVASLTLLLDRESIAEQLTSPQEAGSVAQRRVAVLSALAVIFGAVEICLLFAGFTMFRKVWSAFSSIAHICGLVLTALFMDANWQLGSLAAIFAWCSALPFTVESALSVFVLRFSVHKW